MVEILCAKSWIGYIVALPNESTRTRWPGCFQASCFEYIFKIYMPSKVYGKFERWIVQFMVALIALSYPWKPSVFPFFRYVYAYKATRQQLSKILINEKHIAWYYFIDLWCHLTFRRGFYLHSYLVALKSESHFTLLFAHWKPMFACCCLSRMVHSYHKINLVLK